MNIVIDTICLIVIFFALVLPILRRPVARKIDGNPELLARYARLSFLMSEPTLTPDPWVQELERLPNFDEVASI